MALRDTIYQIQARDSELSEIAANRDQFIRRWREDLEDLYREIALFLQDLVDEGAIRFSTSFYKVKEDELGEYEVPGLELHVANRLLIFAPIARLTSGGTGRVDLFRRDRPMDSERIFIVRRRGQEGHAPWLIEEKRDENDPFAKFASINITAASLIKRNERAYKTLSKLSLENALDFLLRAS